ncbi:MAG: ABC transporter permease, partial [Acidobacteriota bacterium]
VRLDDWRFRVIGVLAPRGESVGLNLDDLVMVPVATGLRLFNKTSLFRIFARARIRSRMEATKEAIRRLLTARHDHHEDVTIISQDSVLTSFNRILHVLTLAIAGIGAVSLGVAGIGVMNVMLVSVSERTEEVGLLLALGVQKRQILAIFLTEAALLAFLGGLVGLGLGYGLSAATRTLYPALPTSPPVWAVGSVLALATLVGLVAGVMPARRAAALDPVISLSRGGGV